MAESGAIAENGSGPRTASFTGTSGTASSRQLKSFIERIERLEEEKKAIADDVRDVFAEAKGQGFDTKVMRQVIKLRKKEPSERQEEEALLDLYLHALGMAGPVETGVAE
jgi:uncharacterized protein (UPF0335 family)